MQAKPLKLNDSDDDRSLCVDTIQNHTWTGKGLDNEKVSTPSDPILVIPPRFTLRRWNATQLSPTDPIRKL